MAAGVSIGIDRMGVVLIFVLTLTVVDASTGLRVFEPIV
jgi:hypothetical protein